MCCWRSNLAVWDLRDESLECVVDLERGQSSKGIMALAGSLCRDQWLFYCVEGSASIKVISLASVTSSTSGGDGKDHGLPSKRISRKTTNHNSQLTTLAYQTALRLLACGSSDGTFQLWAYASSSADDDDGASTGGSSAKDDAAPVSLLFTSTPTAATGSPIVHLAFASSSGAPTSSAAPSSPHYLIVAYQNRAVEVWTLGPLVVGRRPRDPQQVASTQLPPQTSDFAKKNGELYFAMHPQLPLLVIGWNPSAGASSSSVAIWEFGRGNGNGSSIKWRDAKAITPSTGHPVKAPNTSDSDPSAVTAICWVNQSLRMCTCDPSGLSLGVYLLQSAHSSSVTKDSCVSVRDAYSTALTLSLEQYYHYQDTPTTLLQVSKRQTASSGGDEMVLQRFSLLTGSSGAENKLESLPDWKNYQGAQLVPWQMLANASQSAACIKLRERGGDAKASSESFSYVVMEIKKSASGATGARSNDEENGDDNEGGSSSSRSGYRVTCGGQMDALDLCFCESTPQASLAFAEGGDDAAAAPWRLAVLSITGKSLNFQTQCDQVDSASGVLLSQQVRRVFTTPMPLSAASPHAQTVGVRLLYLLVNGGDSAPDVLVLSGDDLNVPAIGGNAGGCYWSSQSNEQVLDVQWNHSATISNSNAPPASAILAAVWTSRRLVILSGPSMTEIRAYDLRSELREPQSALWMAQALLIATRDHQVRYLRPMVSKDAENVDSSGRLLCSLRVPGASGSQTVQLLAVCGDRLCYAVNDSSTLECRSFSRPMTMCEPLLLGYSASSSPQSLSMLRAIFEREVLVFLQSGGGDGPACPLSNALLEAAYSRFGWKKAVVQVLNAVLGRNDDPSPANTSSNSSSAAGTSAGASSSPGGFSRTAHLSRPLLASLLVDSHKWRDSLRVFLADNPALEEYAFADTGDDDSGSISSAKLPSRTSEIARQYRQLASVMDALGQSDLAARCLDLAGDDLALLELLRRLGSSSKCEARAMLAALSKDLARLNAPLASVVEATVSAKTKQEEEQEDELELSAKLASPVWRRHDLFALLCCETLTQTERRSRLLSTVRPFDKMAVSMVPPPIEETEEQQRQAVAPAKMLAWKRLAPEDAQDWIGGASTTAKVSTDDPKPLSYALFASAAAKPAAIGGALGDATGSALSGGSSQPAADDSAMNASAASSSKMTIGPFLEEEDAVVAYWRFEEGAAKASAADDAAAPSSLESVDTSKRENHLTLRGFGSAIKLVPSTAPVDRGEEGKLQEEFALQFPSTTTTFDQDASSSSDWGASCAIRTGGTLDVGFVFDEDPYRRKLTFEAWVRDYGLAREQQRQRYEGDGDDADGISSSAPSSRSTPSARRLLASRRSPDGATVWWELAMGEDARLELLFGSARVLKADSPVENVGAWHHVAFTADVSSPNLATLRLFLNAKCVASQEVSTVDANAAYYSGRDDDAPTSALLLGDRSLRDCEMTEVRVWASARSAEQLGDMKENYLAMAEAKRRMKIAIHQRNCACAKCAARRAAATGAGAAGGVKKLPLASPFMSAPPSTARDRRRPGNK